MVFADTKSPTAKMEQTTVRATINYSTVRATKLLIQTSSL
ncbi:protein of unknown function [[Clostridium] ultunense Esp]|uniref:Uncharacterized protein n=1 Tax=[Clostridium] ultunense Esp TaxID=1288971 RepID=A0A1M4PPP5_9FIRM|nr:protein of unknown function [[Clostridium] ultunense Esp]